MGLNGGPYPHKSDELIVAAPHLSLVTGKLGTLRVPPVETEVSDTLGLARVQLRDVRAAADVIIAAVDKDAEARKLLANPTRGAPPVDRVLAGLRALFGADYAGWAPGLGKNRFVARVHDNGLTGSLTTDNESVLVKRGNLTNFENHLPVPCNLHGTS